MPAAPAAPTPSTTLRDPPAASAACCRREGLWLWAPCPAPAAPGPSAAPSSAATSPASGATAAAAAAAAAWPEPRPGLGAAAAPASACWSEEADAARASRRVHACRASSWREEALVAGSLRPWPSRAAWACAHACTHACAYRDQHNSLSQSSIVHGGMRCSSCMQSRMHEKDAHMFHVCGGLCATMRCVPLAHLRTCGVAGWAMQPGRRCRDLPQRHLTLLILLQQGQQLGPASTRSRSSTRQVNLSEGFMWDQV